MKSVLVHINRDDGQEARLQAALDAVRAFEGHLTCLQVAPLETFAAVDPYGVSYLLAQTVEQIRTLEQEEQAKFEARLANEGLSWDWHCHSGDPARLIADHSWLADLVVVSAPGREWTPRLTAPPVSAEVVMKSRAPVLVVPEASRGFDCGGVVAVAWNGSPEACAALRGALPLLRRASAVSLVAVTGDDDFDLPPIEASTYLARHGVASELVEVKAGDGPVSDALLDAAATRKAACLVSGAYGHSRLRENILGGITRGLLQKSTIPLLLAH
jgi:nucleotide-binding universal stress UspA family protein